MSSSRSKSCIEAHKTAIRRTHLSRPVRLALECGLISKETSVFDYGCGLGDDLRALGSLGITASGWDPGHRPEGQPLPSDIVNLGYVVNVIADHEERSATLRTAFGLAGKLLIVSARLSGELNGVRVDEYGDGCLTRRRTFQKFFEQGELRAWVDETLGVSALAAAPGVFFVFRDSALRESYLATRQRRKAAVPTQRISDRLYEEHQELLSGLTEFFANRGRLPEATEIEGAEAIHEAFGSLKQAFAVVRRVTGAESWDVIRENRRQDLLVYLALSRLTGRPRFGALSSDLQLDVRSHFGTYKKASGEADELLFSAGDLEQVNGTCAKSPVGKITPDAIYVHASGLEHLTPSLRVYEGCARSYVGHVEEANIIKLHRYKAQVSYLTYPKFDKDPHPSLAESLVVSLETLKIRWTDYAQRENPPVLHRKETLLAPGHPLHDRFSRLTRQEERHGLLEEAQSIGTRNGWDERLREAGFRTRGHRLIRCSL